jgi:uncharacterized cupin superfamily protein
MPKIDLETIPQVNRTGYPLEHAAPVAGRWVRRLAPPSGLTDFGASHVVLKAGAWSSQRHWHDGEDEMVVMLNGEAVLVEDDARTILRAGDIAVFPKGVINGHHLINESEADCCFIAIGGGTRTGGGYSDIDMLFTADDRYIHKDGTEYPRAGSVKSESDCPL